MNIGLLSLILKSLPLLIYLTSIVVMLITIIKNSRIGIYFLICILPLTNILIKIQEFPLGRQVTDLIIICILIGTYIQQKKIETSKSSRAIKYLVGVTIFSYFVGMLDFGVIYPVDHFARLQICKNYLIMPLYYYVVFANIENSKHAKIVITLIVILTILVGWRYWSEARWFGTAHFSYDRRISSAFGYLGANHMAAFLIQYAAIVFGIMMYQKKLVFKIILCLTFLLLVFFNFYTYSRASYLALFIVFLFFGFFKIKNFILITLILLLFGGTIYSFLPNSVIERVAGTKTETGEIESSANTRLKLWEDANKLFQNSPIFGVGYQMFPSYVDLHGLKNVHNYFIQTLCEMGIIGLFALIYIFYTAFKSGWFLFKSSINNFDKGIGVGFCGSVVVCIVCNFFGDRWSFTQVQGYWWMIWATVNKLYSINNKNKFIIKDLSEKEIN